ncbi:MAG TPA: CPBP family glutamic-type intramembrane protease [Terriglobales bacterium]|nr:CPBP family glutamic-type intramembrane protease [Terriglobales bacterium]
MDEISNSHLPAPPGEPLSSPPATPAHPIHNIFIGPNGLRAGWRGLIFLALFVITLFFVSICFVTIAPSFFQRHRFLSPALIIANEVLYLMALFFVLFVISRLEHRSIGSYGLPAQHAFKSTFWAGAAVGFVSLTLLLLAIRTLHGFYFGSIALSGRALLHFTVLWAIAFLMVGISEEYIFRGYMQFVLTQGIGFWPAAIVTSLLFGLVHKTNQGESLAGLAAVVAVGLLFCLTLRRTGNLWFAVGFHAAWDYAQTFVYGVPDSGEPGIGHLFNSRLEGPGWLTGGSVGPEGSWLSFVVLALAALFVAWLYPETKYPEPETASASSNPGPAPVMN